MTEQELLAIVETLKEFKGMLWGQPIITGCTDKRVKFFSSQTGMNLTHMVGIGLTRMYTKFEDQKRSRSDVLVVFCTQYSKITSDWTSDSQFC